MPSSFLSPAHPPLGCGLFSANWLWKCEIVKLKNWVPVCWAEAIGFHENILQFSPLGKQFGLIFGLSPVFVGWERSSEFCGSRGTSELSWNRMTKGQLGDLSFHRRSFQLWQLICHFSAEIQRNVSEMVASTWWGHPDPSAPPRKPFPLPLPPRQ